MPPAVVAEQPFFAVLIVGIKDVDVDTGDGLFGEDRCRLFCTVCHWHGPDRPHDLVPLGPVLRAVWCHGDFERVPAGRAGFFLDLGVDFLLGDDEVAVDRPFLRRATTPSVLVVVAGVMHVADGALERIGDPRPHLQQRLHRLHVILLEVGSGVGRERVRDEHGHVADLLLDPLEPCLDGGRIVQFGWDGVDMQVLGDVDSASTCLGSDSVGEALPTFADDEQDSAMLEQRHSEPFLLSCRQCEGQ